MKSYKFLTTCIAVIAIMFSSCSKEDDEIDPQSLSDFENIALDSSIEEVASVLDAYAMYGADYIDFDDATGKSSDKKRILYDRAEFFSDCAIIEEEIVDEISTTTITFEDECLDKNGDIVSGTITITKPTLETDKSRSIVFVDFSINGYVVNGTKSKVHTTENENGNPQSDGTVDLSILTDEGTITKTGTRQVEITSGGDTDTHEDDEKTYTGSYTFTDAEGNSTEVVITTALVKPAGCMYKSSGIKEYTESDEVSILNYGDGTCDDIAELTAPDGTTTEVELKRSRKGYRL